MKKIIIALLLLLSSVAIGQVTYKHNAGKYGQVWYDAEYEKSHTTIADYDSSSIVLLKNDGYWAVSIYDNEGVKVFGVDSTVDMGIVNALNYMTTAGYPVNDILFPQDIQNLSINSLKGSVGLDVKGYEEKYAPVVFDGNSSYTSTCALGNGHFMIAYSDVDNSSFGTFVIYDADSNLVKAPSVFNSGTTTFISATALSNSNVLIAFRDESNSNYGTFVIYDSQGNLVKSPAVFTQAAVQSNVAKTLTNGQVLIAFRDCNNSYYGTFVIYDAKGNEVCEPTIFTQTDVIYISVSPLTDGNVLIAYRDNNNSNRGTFVIAGQNGNIVKTATTFSTGAVSHISSTTNNNGHVLISFRDEANLNYGTLVIYDSQGNLIKSPTVFESGASAFFTAATLPDGNALIAYSDEDNNGYGTSVIYDDVGNEIQTPDVFTEAMIGYTSCCVLTNGNFVISYLDYDNSNYGTFVIYEGSGAHLSKDLQVDEDLRIAGHASIGTDGTQSGNSILYVVNTGNSYDPPIEAEAIIHQTSTVRDVQVLRRTSTGDMVDGFGGRIALEIEDSSAVENGIARIEWSRDGADNSGKLGLVTKNAGTYNTGLVIKSSGNVGIGTTIPSEDLEVADVNANGTTIIKMIEDNPATVSMAALRTANDNTTGYGWFGTAGTGYTVLPGLQDKAFMLAGPNTSGINIYTEGTDDPIVFTTDDTEAMRINDGGNVGIGTASPYSLLHLSQASGNAMSIIQTQTKAGDPILQFKDGDDTDNDTYQFQAQGTTLKLRYGADIAAGAQAGTDLISFLSNKNVGIGTTTPNAELEVANAGVTTIKIHDKSGTSRGDIDFDDESSSRGTLRYDFTSDKFIFVNGGYDRFAIQSDGKIGIGTTTPEYKLDIVGGSASIASNYVLWLGGAKLFESGDNLFIRPQSAQTLNIQGVGGYNNANLSVNSGHLYVDGSSGYVGIGSSSPAANLHVQNGNSTATPDTGGDDFVVEGTASGTGMSILANDDDNVNLYWGSPTDSRGAYARWTHDNDLFTIGTDNSNAEIQFVVNTSVPVMRMDNAGHVGIGTASPDRMLHIYDSTTANLELEGNAGNSYIFMNSGTDGAGCEGSDIYFQDNSNTIWIAGKTSSNDFQIYDNVRGADAMRIRDNGDMTLMENGGNVGIGTTTPNAELEVANAGITTIKIHDKSGTSRGDIDFDDEISSKGTLRYDFNSDKFIFVNGGNDRLVIQNDGKIGIGTTNASTDLHIQTNGATGVKIQSGNNSRAELYFSPNNTDAWRIGQNLVATDNTTLEFFDDVNNLDRMVITQTGSVGIGTSTPESGTALDVQGLTKTDSLHVTGGIILQETDFQGNYASNLQNLQDNQIGPYYFFDGINDVVTVTDNSAIDFGTDDFSIVAHFNTSSNDNYNTIVSKGRYDIAQRYWAVTTHGGKPGFSMGDSSTAIQSTFTEGTLVNDGNWHTVVMVVERNTATDVDISCYIDGKQNGQTRNLTMSGNGNVSNSDDLLIGRSVGGDYFFGDIGKVLLFNRILANDEIKYYSNPLAQTQYAHKDAIGNYTYESDFSTGVDGFASARGTAAGNIDDIGGQNDNLRFTVDTDNNTHYVYRTGTFSVGKDVIITFDYYIPSGQSHVDGIKFGDGSTYSDNQTVTDSWTTATMTINSTKSNIFWVHATDNGLFTFQDTGGDDVFYIRNVKIKHPGCVAEYVPQNASAAAWYDAGSNNLNATISGAALVSAPKHLFVDGLVHADSVYTEGGISALYVTDRCNWFDGDALSLLMKLQKSAGAPTGLEGFTSLDHTTLPKGARKEKKTKVWKAKVAGKHPDLYKAPTKDLAAEYYQTEETDYGRDLGDMNALNSRAIQQLYEMVMQLQNSEKNKN